MTFRFFFKKAIFCFFFIISALQADESISSKRLNYRITCLEAYKNDETFNKFRSLKEYSDIVEIYNGSDFYTYILKFCMDFSEKFKDFENLDKIGSPSTSFFPSLGQFSATTLRYIVIADDILKSFDLPKNPSVCEIGGVFGGQCYILSKLLPFSKYDIYDLPEVNFLIKKLLHSLEVKKFKCKNLIDNFSEEKIDLLVSNYAFSECDYKTQMKYFNKVIVKADRGYMIYNQIARTIFGMDTMTPNEFIKLLKEKNMNPKIHPEPINTCFDNVLITWSKE
jgi:hypothetical protein